MSANTIYTRADLAGRAPGRAADEPDAPLINEAMSALSRHELQSLCPAACRTLSASRPGCRSCSLELARSTLPLLDEPTDNLDPPSAEALQQGLEFYQGTVLAVTHDRWFARRSSGPLSSPRTATSARPPNPPGTERRPRLRHGVHAAASSAVMGAITPETADTGRPRASAQAWVPQPEQKRALAGSSVPIRAVLDRRASRWPQPMQSFARPDWAPGRMPRRAGRARGDGGRPAGRPARARLRPAPALPRGGPPAPALAPRLPAVPRPAGAP